ncbi:hypothetical protein MKZ38_009394 [Zalerion maritima]|uniref:Uncharacterized protein n=1 Tax=Zalerion maritima TaxID=339359 RepID=A0AAD5RTB9_9PEZI|nr:hypothetical protein MKZ38_009394 [Zalerion maritima]
MSSIQLIHDQLNTIKHAIVCVDAVDLDNIWQCLWALGRVPNAHIHIAISPRVLDLRVPTFADRFGGLMKELGPKYMLDVLNGDPEEIYDKLQLLGDAGLRDYFGRDATFQDDPHTMVFMRLYLALSALRFAFKFDTKGHDRSRYTFYWDPRSIKTIIPGIRHPTHVNDYLYASSEEDRRKSTEYLHLSGPERETKMVEIMERTAERLAEQLGYNRPGDILHPIEELINQFNGISIDTKPLVLGGGPFTEMARILEDTDLAPLAIVAMARTWWGDTNIFPNNYNDLMDLDAAWKVEQIAKARSIPTWFFPTECAKSKVVKDKIVRPCHWDFSTEELITIFQTAGDMESYQEADTFTRETKTLSKMHMFDVLTVVPLAHPDALPYRRAESYWASVGEQRVLRVRETGDGPVNVFFPEAAAMEKSKETAMQEISYVLSPVSRRPKQLPAVLNAIRFAIQLGGATDL